MAYKEYFSKIFYDEDTGEEIARIRVKLEASKGITMWSTTQLEGIVLGKWLPLKRYDFNPNEKGKPKVHLDKEYLGTKAWEKILCSQETLIKMALKELLKINNNQIKELIKKREDVFKKKENNI